MASRNPPKKKQQQQMPADPSRTTILQAVTAPIGFFVLALLIVETFLATVLLGGNLEPQDKLTALWAGIGMFVLVTCAVFILVWAKPSHLTYDKHAHLVDRGKIPYGSDEGRVTPDELFKASEKGPAQAPAEPKKPGTGEAAK